MALIDFLSLDKAITSVEEKDDKSCQDTFAVNLENKYFLF